MELTPKEKNRLRDLDKKKRKNRLRGAEVNEYERLLAKRDAPNETSAPASQAPMTKPVVEQPKTPTFTITVDSEEKRDAIQAAIDDIDNYRKMETDKINAEIAEMKTQAEKDIQANAEAQTATECQNLIDAANKEAESIKAVAKEESEKESAECREQIQKELEAAVADHKKYAEMLAQITAQKIDYRNEALNDVQSEIETITNERKELLAEANKYKVECDKLSRQISELEGDLESYVSAYGKNKDAHNKLTTLELEKDFMDSQYAALEQHYKEKSEEVVRLTNKLLEMGDDPEEIRARMEYLNAEVERLRTQLDKYPTNWEAIVQRSSELDVYSQKLEELNERNRELNNQIFDLQLQQTELEDYRLFVKTLELQRDELKAELDRIVAQYENRNGKVFAGLSEIDTEVFERHKSKSVNLKKLCENFRSYLNCRGSDKTSNKPSLYYDARTIRTFIAGFASSRTMIFEGLSGTGKTSLPLAFADYMGSVTDVVAVQSSWKDKNDLLGFYNDFRKQYTETDFLKYLYRAACDSSNIHIIVLDEMNLSRIEYYFADVLSKLELSEGKKMISLIPNALSIGGPGETWPSRINNGELEIPDNVWFIGTANKDDSTFTITDKVYDRSVVISFDSKGVYDKNLKYVGPDAIAFEDFKKALNATAWSEGSDEHEKFVKIMENLDELLAPFEITFGNRIYRQLERFVPAYIACGGDMAEAIDVMFSLKIIRKLEGLYDERTKSNLENLEAKLPKEMPLSKARVKNLRSRIA